MKIMKERGRKRAKKKVSFRDEHKIYPDSSPSLPLIQPYFYGNVLG
jgi:hypothetical protein